MSDFGKLEHSVRHGLKPDNPQLVTSYIAMAENFSRAQSSISQKREILKRVLTTLLETICDSYVQKHWRHHCLNNIYKPLHAVERYASGESDKAEIRRFRQELNTLGNYFL